MNFMNSFMINMAVTYILYVRALEHNKWTRSARQNAEGNQQRKNEIPIYLFYMLHYVNRKDWNEKHDE